MKLAKLNDIHGTDMAIDNEQEALKAKMKGKTEELSQTMAQMEELYREAKKVVKLEIPQEYWKEYGIADQR